MTLELSADQEAAVVAVASWLEKGDFENKPFFFLAGFAGVGKSTVAHILADGRRTKYACAAGKAARVLTRKGSPAQTIHSLAYLPLGDINDEIKELQEQDAKITVQISNKETPLSDARIKLLEKKRDVIFARIAELREPKFILNAMTSEDKKDFIFDDDLGFRSSRKPHPLKGIQLLVLDEVSMVSHDVAQDLMTFRIPMLVLGDPGQLPPIKGAGYFTERTPDFMLSEIHRQAADNPILKIATAFREGKTPACGRYGDSKVTTRFKITDDDLVWADQVLCGSNKNRISLNQRIRGIRGFSGVFPRKGERLMCLRNNKKEQIFNGQIFTALEDFDEEYNVISLLDDEGVEKRLFIHPQCFTRPGEVASWDYRKRQTRNEFDFSWACTTHKFQGSEDSKILVYGDAHSWMRDKTDLARHAYTGATRAADALIYAL